LPLGSNKDGFKQTGISIFSGIACLIIHQLGIEWFRFLLKYLFDVYNRNVCLYDACHIRIAADCVSVCYNEDSVVACWILRMPFWWNR
jgi:hypothetical protein